MADQEQDNEDDFTVTPVEEADRPTVNVEATWQEYEDAVEFRFTAGEAKIEVTVPYDEPLTTRVLVASLPQAFETALIAYFDACAADEEAESDVSPT